MQPHCSFGETKRTLFTGLAEMFPIKFTTDEVRASPLFFCAVLFTLHVSPFPPATSLICKQHCFFTRFFPFYFLHAVFLLHQVADYTFQFTFTERVVRLRAETKSAFDQWRGLFERLIPLVRPDIKHEGWLWRQLGRAWEQRYAIIQNGVLFYFRSSEDCEKFKLISARTDDSLFIAATLTEGMRALVCAVLKHVYLLSVENGTRHVNHKWLLPPSQ